MYYTSVSATQASTVSAPARRNARAAVDMVKERTGMNVAVLQYPTEMVNNTPQRMLHVIAMALDMSPEAYKMKTRVRNVVELRFIATLFLRQYFPALTLQQIAAYFGGQDHSSVINGLSRAYNLIYIQDAEFLKKYNAVLKSVTSWLRKEA